MTSRMQSCVDHIKTSLDVDPWAMELVEQVFEEYDKRFDKVLEIIDGYKATEPTKLSASTHNILLDRMKHDVLALKGGDEE